MLNAIILVLKKDFFILFESKSYREQDETENERNLPLLLPFPNELNSQSWAILKLGVKSLFHVSHMDGGAQELESSSTAFPDH